MSELEEEVKPKVIDKKIVGYKVVTESNKEEITEPVLSLEVLNEYLARPEMLLGSTYKIKPPNSEHALYITINDVILNTDTEHEVRRPYEIFINSKNMEHFQWVIALTRIISSVFRKGGNIVFLVDELKAVFDPKGGYFKRGGIFMPSLVAEIGFIIEKHLVTIGLIKKEELSTEQKKFIEDKKEEFKKKESTNEDGWPEKATVCTVCKVKAVVIMDGCGVCLACSYSKCS